MIKKKSSHKYEIEKCFFRFLFYSEGAVRCGCQLDLGIRNRDRNNGQYLIDSFNQVKESAQWIVFEVWNEYHEGNDLSYSLEYQDQYINLTRQLIDEFQSIRFFDWRPFDSILTGTAISSVALIGIIIKGKKLKNVPNKNF